MKNSIQFGKKYCKSQYYYAGLFDTFSSGLIKQSVECIFDNMALHFECRINKNVLFQTVFFGDFAHWVTLKRMVNLYA